MKIQAINIGITLALGTSLLAEAATTDNPFTTNHLASAPADGWFTGWSNGVPVWTLNLRRGTNLDLTLATNNDTVVSNGAVSFSISTTNGLAIANTNLWDPLGSALSATNGLAQTMTNRIQGYILTATNTVGTDLRQERSDSTNQLAIVTTNRIQGYILAATNTVGTDLRQERTDSTNSITSAWIQGKFPGLIVTNGETQVITVSNQWQVDAAHQLVASNLTTSRVLLSRADSGITNASASGAAPINSDGTATTFAQLPGPLGNAARSNKTDFINTSGGYIPGVSNKFYYVYTNVTRTLNNWWTFDECGGSTITDYGSGASTGTLSGTQLPWWSAGPIGCSLGFGNVQPSATSSFVQLSTNTVGGAMTFSAWINWLGFPQGGYVIYDSDGDTNKGFYLFISGNARICFFGVFSSADMQRASLDSSVTAGTWCHVAITWDGSTTAANCHIYTNGVETGYATTFNGSGSHSINTTTNRFLASHDTPGDAGGLRGYLDDVRVYSSVLDLGEITNVSHWVGTAALPGNILTNNETAATVFSNTVKIDVAHTLSLSNLTASRVVLSGADDTLVSAAASGDVPIEADGSASTSSDIQGLFPGVIMTNGGTTAITYSNALRIDAAHTLSLSNATASTVLKSGADLTVSSIANGGNNTVLHGTTGPTYTAVVEADQSLTDITTANASTSAHGYLPKLSGATSQYLNGNGAYTSGTSLTNNVVTQSANYNVLLTDTFVLLTGAHTATMPSPTAANTSGHRFWIQCSSAGTNAILRNGSETFNGNMGTSLTKLTNTAVGKATMLWSDGANWWYVQL